MRLTDAILYPSVYTHSFTVWERQALCCISHKTRPLPRPLQQLQSHFGASRFPSSCASSSSCKTSLNRSSLQLQVTTQQFPGLLLSCNLSLAMFPPLKHSLVQLLPMLLNYYWTYWLERPTDTTQPHKLQSRLISLLGRQTDEVGIPVNYLAQPSASTDYGGLNLDELIWEPEEHWFLSCFLGGPNSNWVLWFR